MQEQRPILNPARLEGKPLGNGLITGNPLRDQPGYISAYAHGAMRGAPCKTNAAQSAVRVKGSG
jgi:hypothetical protein